MEDLYDMMLDDYLTWDALACWSFETRKELAKKFGVNPENFTEEELNLLNYKTTDKCEKLH